MAFENPWTRTGSGFTPDDAAARELTDGTAAASMAFENPWTRTGSGFTPDDAAARELTDGTDGLLTELATHFVGGHKGVAVLVRIGSNNNHGG
nr:hypothetical protein [Mycobacterium tuberculosis]